jgi:UDP-N-acetyl-2-amino-2-deoxyglucuronate dehydrogenase
LSNRYQKPLSIALVGMGRVAEKHLKAIRFWEQKHRLQLIAGVKLRPEAGTERLKRHGFRRSIPVYATIEQMLAEAKPDICAITTPSGSHFDLAEKALQAGCHLLIEKPLTLDLDQADYLLDLADKADLKIAVGHIFRYAMTMQELQADLSAGHFGRILYGSVIVRWGHNQAYYEKQPWRGSWQDDGGVLMNQTVHALDLMTWLCDSLPITANCELARLRHQIEAEDFGLGIFRLANGALLSVEGTTVGDPGDQEAALFIQTEKASIRASKRRGSHKLSVLDQDGRSHSGEYIRRHLRRQVRRYGLLGLKQLANPHTTLYDDLIRCIRENREPLASGISGRDAVAMVLSLYQSYRERRPIKYPPSERRLTPQDI